MTQGGRQGIIILPIKSKIAAAKKQCFLRFLYWTESSPQPFKVRGLQMTINLAWLWTYISSWHSNLSFAHNFVIYWLFQNGAKKNQHQESYQRETIPDKFVFVLFCFLFVVCLFVCLFFPKLVRQKKKKSIGWAKHVYVCEWDMCCRNFCNFSLVTKKCEK